MKITKQLLETIVREELAATLEEVAPAGSIPGVRGSKTYYPLDALEPIYAQVMPMVNSVLKDGKSPRINAIKKSFRDAIEADLAKGKGKELPSDIVLYAPDTVTGGAEPTRTEEAIMNALQRVVDKLAAMEAKVVREELQDEPEDEYGYDPEEEYDDAEAIKRTIQIATNAGMTGPALEQLKSLLASKRG